MPIDGIPEYAERVDLFDLVKLIKQPSRFAPKVAAIVTKLECPVCRVQQDDPGTHKTAVCPCCGLHMQIGAGASYIWRLPPKAAE